MITRITMFTDNKYIYNNLYNKYIMLKTYVKIK